ncbi:hypothetical protein EDD15DRAFT_342902 [Pisolithus albus]|nr:hypothetical protein EDD15DRAFT_342902 [Pisolithus albus]
MEDRLVLKYAPPYVVLSILRGPTKRPLSSERQKFEAEALRLSHQFSIQSDQVTVEVPALRLYVEEMHVIIDDAGIGSHTLKEVLINETLPTALLEEVGIALELFLGHFHGSHKRRDGPENEVRKEISARMTYSRIVSTLNRQARISRTLQPSSGHSKQKNLRLSLRLKKRGRGRSGLRPLRTPRLMV